MKRPRNWLLFSIIVLTWGANWSVMKVGLEYIDPVNFTLHRLVLASVVLLPLAAAFRTRVPRDRRTLTLLLGLGLFNVTSVILVLEGMVHETSSLSAILAHTQPLFVLMLAVPLLHEELTPTRGLGLLFGFAGLVVLSVRDEGITLGVGNSLVLLLVGAALWAVTVVYYKRYLSHVDPVVTNIVQMWVGAAALTPVGLMTVGLSFPLTVAYLPLVAFSSLAAFGLGLTLWILLLREEEATVLSFSGLLVPLVAFLFGWLLLHEQIDPRVLLGAALILLGVCLVNRVPRT